MHTTLRICVLAVLAGVAVQLATPVGPREVAGATTVGLHEGASTKEELIDRFVNALALKDSEMLRRLRVTEDEYLDVILPGAVPEGEPLRQWDRSATEYFWHDLDTKSRYFEQGLLARFGGHTMKVHSVEYEKGVRRNANHVAYRQLRLVVEDEAGTEKPLATGSIVEVGGQYKFESFLARD